MSNIKLVHSGGNSVSITTPDSNPAANRTLKVPGNADGTVLTSKFGPSFAARNNSAQTITNSTTATMQFDTEYYDTDNCYNTSNYRFTPNVAGIYLINSTVMIASLTGIISLDIRLNGARYANTALRLNPTGLQAVANSVLVSMNGSTDYVDIGIFQNSGSNKDTVASPSNNLVNHFSGCYMRGQA
tara:strand:+ start:672 stop:1229 length:558 start_codon:yes stop_codon:yes gene_type:complete